jgi:hypothetical protein
LILRINMSAFQHDVAQKVPLRNISLGRLSHPYCSSLILLNFLKIAPFLAVLGLEIVSQAVKTPIFVQVPMDLPV